MGVRRVAVLLASLLATLLVSSLVIFVLLEVLPGDPAEVMLGISATPETIAALRAELGLHQSPWQRYWQWLGGMLVGDFGISYSYRIPVATLIYERMLVTIPLAVYALLLTLVLAIPLALMAANRVGGVYDRMFMAVSQFGIALPNFWFAILLIAVFAVERNWFPAGGFAGWEAGITQAILALTLPAVSLAIPQATILFRITRASLLEVASQDYIRLARAKGLSKQAALIKHGFRNAMIPIVTIMGLQCAFLVAGAIIIENVFALPGLGRLVVQAIGQRDLIVIEAVILLLVGLVVSISFIVDMLYMVIDPRQKERGV